MRATYVLRAGWCSGGVRRLKQTQRALSGEAAPDMTIAYNAVWHSATDCMQEASKYAVGAGRAVLALQVT